MAEKMVKKPEVQVQSKSGEYYVFPGTLEPITAKTPRSVNASFADGKFVYPKVKIDGKDCRFVYSVWTEEERKAYRDYKASLGTGTKGVDAAKLDELQSIVEKSVKGESLKQALELIAALRPPVKEQKDRKFENMKAKIKDLTPEQVAEMKAMLA